MTQTAEGLPQLGITLFSLTLEMREPDYSLERMIRRVAELDLGPGLELVGFQSLRGWPNVDDELVRWFRGLVEELELVPTAMSMNLDLAKRRDRWMTEEEGLAYIEAQMVAAKKLGFPIGKSAIESTPTFVEGLARIAERLDMTFGVEIHSPESVDSPHVAELRELFDDVGSPRLGFIPDFSSSMHDVPPGLVAAHRASGMPEELIALVSEVWHSDSTMPEKFARFGEEAGGLGASPGGPGQAQHGPDDAREHGPSALGGADAAGRARPRQVLRHRRRTVRSRRSTTRRSWTCSSRPGTPATSRASGRGMRTPTR